MRCQSCSYSVTAGSLAKAETQLPRGLGSMNRLDAINRQRQSDVTSLTYSLLLSSMPMIMSFSSSSSSSSSSILSVNSTVWIWIWGGESIHAYFSANFKIIALPSRYTHFTTLHWSSSWTLKRPSPLLSVKGAAKRCDVFFKFFLVVEVPPRNK